MAAEMSSPQAAVGDSDQLGDGRSALQVEVFTVPKKASEPHTKLSGAALMFKSSVFRNAARNLVLIGVWYFLSTFLTLYNKVLLGQHKGIFGDSGFPAPLFMTALQFMFQWLLSSIVLYAPCCSPTKAQEPFDFYEWLTKVLPNAASTGLDIGLSNRSLAYISVSFYTMCKSTVPLWLLTFAFIFRIERPSCNLFIVISVMSTGLLLLVAGETEFHPVGFFMVMTAAMLSGFRWTITQIQLQPKEVQPGEEGPADEEDKQHGKATAAVEVMKMLYPVMAATVMLMALVSEKLWTLNKSPYFESMDHTLLTLLAIGSGACIAFLMFWTELKVIQNTSAITFMVAGTCKEVITVISGVVVFGDKFHLVNGFGLVILMIGVAFFNYIKLKKVKQGMIKARPATMRLGPTNAKPVEEMRLLQEGSRSDGGSIP